jgi:hypothetical protein
MDAADRNYFLDRAEEEITQANEATQAEVARVHYHLAAYYLDRVYGDPPEPDQADAAAPSPLSTLPSVER